MKGAVFLLLLLHRRMSAKNCLFLVVGCKYVLSVVYISTFMSFGLFIKVYI